MLATRLQRRNRQSRASAIGRKPNVLRHPRAEQERSELRRPGDPCRELSTAATARNRQATTAKCRHLSASTVEKPCRVSPLSPGLAAAGGGNAEATERGKQPGGARTSRHKEYNRKARPRAPLPELLTTMARPETGRGAGETYVVIGIGPNAAEAVLRPVPWPCSRDRCATRRSASAGWAPRRVSPAPGPAAC